MGGGLVVFLIISDGRVGPLGGSANVYHAFLGSCLRFLGSLDTCHVGQGLRFHAQTWDPKYVFPWPHVQVTISFQDNNLQHY